jgi:hypothetical protein
MPPMDPDTVEITLKVYLKEMRREGMPQILLK